MTTPSAPISSARLINPPLSSAKRTRATVSLRTAARTCSMISFQSRWPCSASITTQSKPMGDGHFRNARRFEHDPQAEDRRVGGQLLSQLLDGGGFHAQPSQAV